jgi:hypothetical protein
MTVVGQSRHLRDICVTSGSPSTADIRLTLLDGNEGPCVDGSELARVFFTCAALVGAAAGHNALRGSGPGQ